eukprot:PITA_04033
MDKISEIHNKWLRKYEYLEVKANKSAGGILMLWNPHKLGILDAEASRNYLLLVIQPLGDRETYMITNVYGPQKLEDKLKLLTTLEELRERYPDMPWILAGDFNMIKSRREKKGDTITLGTDSITFQNFINKMRLVDFETIKCTFTWNNKRGGASQVSSKLDRFIILEDLLLTGLDMSNIILPFGGSDHWPIQLEAAFMGTPRNTPFRFENVWLSHPEFTSNIDKWCMEDFPIQGTKMFMMQQISKHIKSRLKDWNKKEFDGFTEERKTQAESLKKEWEDRCIQEEIFWRKKSRVQWIREGEKNTKFFHKSTLDHRGHNKISKLKYFQWKELVSHKEMESILVQHFLSIAKEPLLDRPQFINNFTKYIPKLVTREDNHNLNRPMSEYEVSEVINEMKNGNFFGLDGFSVDFFKAFWKTIK